MRKRHLVVAGVSVLLLLGFGVNYQPTSEARTHIKIKLTDFHKQLGELQARDFDVAGVNLKTQEVGLVVTLDQATQLRSEGFNIQKEESLLLNVDEEYKNPAEIETILKNYGAQYPNLTEVMSIGKTEQGRDLWAIKIANKNNFSRLKKPTIYVNGMHHAREVMSPEIPLDMIDYLLINYGRDPKVNHWVDQNEIWIVPMVNPDGNNVVWTSNNWWRKNVTGGYGVDINRNYPYMWGQCGGSSGNTRADNYRGPSAGSEKETQAIANLIQNIRPVTSLSLHSYGELVLYPLSCQGQQAPHKEFFRRVGGQIARLIPGDGGGFYTPGTPWEILYSVDGGDIDWLYKEYQVMPFVIEMNQEFQVNYRQYRDKTVTKLRAAWMTLLTLLDGSGVRGVAKGVSEIKIKNLSGGGAWTDYTYHAGPDGSFHVLLDPGVYEVNGQKVTVGKTRVDL